MNFTQYKSTKKSIYLPEIDGLKAFAILTLIINHFNKNILPGGYLGVDIFFVISGFLITSSLCKIHSRNFEDFISDFYERRVKRLVPALSVFILIMSFAICLINPQTETSLKTGLSSLFGLSNIFLFKQSIDYFAKSTEFNVFMHTWALSIQVQFYLFFPHIIWFSGWGRHTKNGARNLFLTVGALAIASLIGFLYLYPINQSAAFFQMQTRFWEMAAGCWIFIGLQKRKSIRELLESVSTILVLLMILGVMFLPKSLAIASTIAVVFLSVLLIASFKKGTAAYKIFTHPKVLYIGHISYSLYLWHWGVLSISRWTIGIHWWSVPLQVALMLGLAISSYRYIETPILHDNWFKKRWQTIAISAGILISLSMNFVVLGKPLKGKLFIGDKYNKWNMKFYEGTKIIHNKSLPTIYFIGDSHVGHYGAVVTKLSENKDSNWIMHPQGSGLKLLKKDMKEFVLAPLREYKNKFKKGDTIVFSARDDKYYKNGQDWTNLYSTFIRETQNMGIKFILISPTPTFSGIQGGYICQEEWFRPSWAISPLCIKQVNKQKLLANNVVPIKRIEKFLLANPQVYYMDTFSILCPNKYCKNHDKNELMYKDNYHLNGYGALKLSKTFETFLRSK